MIILKIILISESLPHQKRHSQIAWVFKMLVGDKLVKGFKLNFKKSTFFFLFNTQLEIAILISRMCTDHQNKFASVFQLLVLVSVQNPTLTHFEGKTRAHLGSFLACWFNLPCAGGVNIHSSWHRRIEQKTVLFGIILLLLFLSF